MLRLRDTATGRVSELTPRDAGVVGLYVCGPTVYGPPHTGHGRFALVYDVLRRYLEFEGLRVDHVSNVTDIDDKIIERAASEGRDWRAVAQESEAEWWAAMDAMGLARPSATPHATDYITPMIEFVGELLARSAAYETGDGVYLDTSLVADYGLLKHQTIDSLRAGARVEVDEQKKSPVDFALWKRSKSGEPTWEAPFGSGRPGWHTECVVMSLALLGENFDLHGGGEDLIFPHHENERAQAVADGKRFARRWMHNGLVRVGGEKMSKSLGNITKMADLLARSDARAYRLLVLGSHYRQPVEVNERTLEDATTTLQRVDSLARRFADASPEAAGDEAGEARQRFRDAMDDDLDTARALGGLFSAMRRANALADAGDAGAGGALARAVLDLFAALGVAGVGSRRETDGEVQELVRRRDAARLGRDYAAADRLRAEIERLGWVVEDTPAGTRVYR
ncbi:MAG: cysteine--tRNA ligase [Acidimicrobiales bacterium]